MATLRTRPRTGTLYLDFRHHGRRFRIETGRPDTVANRRTLSAVIARIEREREHGTFDPALLSDALGRAPRSTATDPSAPPLGAASFAAFAESWFTWQSPAWRIATRTSVRITLDRHLLPTFGTRPLSSLTNADVLGFRAALVTRAGRSADSTLAPRTVNRHLGVLSAILRQAAQHLRMDDPTQGLRRLRESRSEVLPFTLEQIRQLCEAAPTAYRDYLQVRFFTGLRGGEIDALTWDAIDFSSGTIRVRATLGRRGLQAPKSDGARREVRMSHPVREALARRAATAGPHRSGWVFTAPEGGAIQSDNFRTRVWQPLLAALGLAYRSPHHTRHTCASLWLACGETPEWIARQLGHTNTELLFRVYSRFIPNAAGRDGQAIERLLRSAAVNAASPAPVQRRSPGSTVAPTEPGCQMSLLGEAVA